MSPFLFYLHKIIILVKKYFSLWEENSFRLYNTIEESSTCYYCGGFNTNNKREYERHIIIEHPGKLAYPPKMELAYRVPPFFF